MVQIGLIGLGAGAAAALLFASVASGVWLSIPLFYLAPLPILIAGLGWSHWAALIAAAAGAVGLAAVFGTVFFFAFLAGAGLPAWWLGYLAMLARPAMNGSGNTQLEWYPPGRLVIWAAILAALTVILAIPNFGGDVQGFRSALHDALLQVLHSEAGIDAGAPASVPAVKNVERLVHFLVVAVPPAAAVVATITSLFNLWLATRIVKFSALLKRPWPQLSDLTFPRTVAALLAATIVLNFAGGLIGIAAGVLTASLLMAYSVLGLAVLHAITQGMNSRAFVLGGAYAAVIVFGWPVLALCVLGLIETAFDLRARMAKIRRGPPART
jgi:uncharacterized protein YybS (DUF2232 family)